MSEPADRKPASTTFTNSLREWQARYKAQQPAAPTEDAPPPRAKLRPRRGRKAAQAR